MLQEILIALVFIAALIYIGQLVYRSFAPNVGSSQTGCPKGCGSCSAVDFEKIKREIVEKQQAK